MITQNITNWFTFLFFILTICFIIYRFKNRVTIEDQKNNLTNFFNNILYYEQLQKIENIQNLQNIRKNNFSQSRSAQLLMHPNDIY